MKHPQPRYPNLTTPPKTAVPHVTKQLRRTPYCGIFAATSKQLGPTEASSTKEIPNQNAGSLENCGTSYEEVANQASGNG
jgi:hypothetical protein